MMNLRHKKGANYRAFFMQVMSGHDMPCPNNMTSMVMTALAVHMTMLEFFSTGSAHTDDFNREE